MKKSVSSKRNPSPPAPGPVPERFGPELSSVSGISEPPPSAPDDDASLGDAIKEVIIGKPRNLRDRAVFQHISLIAFLAWVGLGADGLSSSCYGPAEAFHNLKNHSYLAVFLALATIVTVFVISACYRHIIEVFPSGGGGYVVASKLLGPKVGAVSGCALLVDYVLTVTVSIAAAGDALFGLIGAEWEAWKIPAETAAIVALIVLNLRGVRESVTILLPIFLLFLLTHAILIVGAVGWNLGAAGEVAREVKTGITSSLADPKIGIMGMLAILLHAYSLGAGTYTGIEAVSNSMAVMREPRVATGKRTMLYMAVSLALTAGGLVIAFLLLKIEPAEGKTMNQVLTEAFMAEVGLGSHWTGETFVLVTIAAEGALLIVAAQAGFIDGPRVLANMALDSWAPHPFANLSERLAVHNGVLLMGLAAVGALFYTGGNVATLVIMYSINVFVTFSLSMLAMCRHWAGCRNTDPLWKKRMALFVLGAAMCLSILGVTVYEKFHEGGWKTILITGACLAFCFVIHGYYQKVRRRLRTLEELADRMPEPGDPTSADLRPNEPTAAVLVGGYGGLGIHTLLNVSLFAPNYFKNFVFIGVGVVDSGSFKGAHTLDDLKEHTRNSLRKYVELARGWGFPARYFLGIGTDAVDELERICLRVKREYPGAVFFAGQLVFQKDTWYQRLLHNQTAFAILRRLQWDRVPVVILPTRVQ